MNDRADSKHIYTVSGLNREVGQLLAHGLPPLWVEGEVSNFSAPASGHWYFTLKDRDSQLRCAMFRGRQSSVRFRPANGQHINVRGRVGLYEPRGDYQMTVELMEEAGEGQLRREFDLLKQRLAAEGLFDAARKRPLPALPRRIAVITSGTGAALRDILNVLQQRYRLAQILLLPVPVQGAAAAPAICAALDTVSRRDDCQVVILARGGGSLEDLWAVNEETVARAIYRPTVQPRPADTGTAARCATDPVTAGHATSAEPCAAAPSGCNATLAANPSGQPAAATSAAAGRTGRTVGTGRGAHAA